MAEPSRNEVSEFYDQYTANQQKVAYNERHYHLVEKLKLAGLQRNSRVLELGCGIGVISSLVAPLVSEGKLVATDLSEESINQAKARVTAPQVQFSADDLLEFDRTNQEFDFITLFDVLEHIPADMVDRAVEVIGKHMGPKTELLLNIPNGPYLDHIRKTQPELLQIIDNSIDLGQMNGWFTKHGMYIREMEIYGLWAEEEYQFYRIAKRQPYTHRPITPAKPGLTSRIRNKLGI